MDIDILGIPLFDNDFYKMLFRFVLNIAFITLIISVLYYKTTKDKEYLFTYYMISTIVFFLCFTLKKYELDVGMALGLFAIFGIIRYRTDAIAIKEMTYLFVVIGVSVINSLANHKMSYFEIIGANVLIVAVIIIIERIWLLSHEVSQIVLYEKIENIKPENRHLLINDLEERTGLKVSRVSIDHIDFLRDVASIKVYYFI